MTVASDRTGQPLTTRELAVCIAIANGRFSQQIANQMRIGLDAAKAVIGRVFDKVGVQVPERGCLLTVLFRAGILAFDDDGRPTPGPGAGQPVPEAARRPQGGFWLFNQALGPEELGARYSAAAAQRDNWIAGKT